MSRYIALLAGLALWAGIGGCTIKYSASGARIDPAAKTVLVRFFENRAPQNNPQLSQNITEKLRQKILAQTRLAQTNDQTADYEFRGTITGYSVSNSAVTNIDKPASARLTITVNVTFITRVGDKKGGFTNQSFSRSADFNAQRTIAEAESALIAEIVPNLVDDIFNRAFANW
ncbi:LptE family protein [Chitinophaga sp. NPDC101104]|uniref:LptE family protein n=1 Tax=Chitinophaga sp. NPDC101104 TaxID=3390561 RepID=UPI003D07F129